MKQTDQLETKDSSTELKHIDVAFEITETKDDGDFFIFKGLASTWEVDLVDDRFQMGAFAESIAKQLPTILWQHQRLEPIGMPISIKETQAGLEVEGKLPKEDSFVSGRVIPQMKVGSIKAMSVGFRPQQAGPDPTNLPFGRLITKAILREVSLVTFPANPGAKITDLKHFQDDLLFAKRNQSWDEKGASERIGLFCVGDSPTEENYLIPETKQLLFTDVVEGKRVIIPRALNQAKSILPSLEISEEEKEHVLELIKGYQSKLDKTEPKKDFYTELDVKEINSKKEFERLLRDSGLFSRDAAMLLAKHFKPETEKSESSSDDDEVKTVLDGLIKKMDDHETQKLLNRILKR